MKKSTIEELVYVGDVIDMFYDKLEDLSYILDELLNDAEEGSEEFEQLDLINDDIEDIREDIVVTHNHLDDIMNKEVNR